MRQKFPCVGLFIESMNRKSCVKLAGKARQTGWEALSNWLGKLIKPARKSSLPERHCNEILPRLNNLTEDSLFVYDLYNTFARVFYRAPAHSCMYARMVI